ncbi:2,3-dihydrosybenzoate-AMP ligase (entE) [marine gamma proteobacterium HTCC2080]|jgi:acyl-CoA synthetase (AMP-forming)/AMP-acid ligase II|nr:2,3-dihydrosybenzoate-AMP ligase (entE) [marine gamma proteobacterium HTCC2080]
MQTSTNTRIRALTERGFWGQDSLHGLLAERVAQEPHALAVADQPDKMELTGMPPARLSFSDLDIASTALALQLLERGIGPGSRIMVQLPNIVELVVCFYAASKLGAIISPLPVQYGAHEITQLSTTLQTTLFIGCPSFKGQSLIQTARDVLPRLPVLAIGDDLECLASSVPLKGTRTLATYSRSLNDPANRVLTVCWTSGTTGTPKGVPRSANMWLATARATAEAGGYQRGDRLLNPFPLVNMAAIGGFLFAAAELGCGLILHHPLDPAVYLTQMQDEKIHFTIAPPALLNQLAAQPEFWQQFDFSTLRAVGSGSAPLSPAMIATFENDYQKPVINFYGSNEGLALFATPETVPSSEMRAAYFPRFGTPGLEWPGRCHHAVQSKVIDPDTGLEVDEPGAVGELCFAGATVFDGYFGTEDTDVFTEDGFFRSGDLVEISAAPTHYYRIVGRCKDIINRGGMKISPAELDTLIESHPQVREAAVCAYADQALGERVCVCLVPKDADHPPSLKEVCGFLKAQGLAKFKLPEKISYLVALPRNPMGKVLRGDLQADIAAVG